MNSIKNLKQFLSNQVSKNTKLVVEVRKENTNSIFSTTVDYQIKNNIMQVILNLSFSNEDKKKWKEITNSILQSSFNTSVLDFCYDDIS